MYSNQLFFEFPMEMQTLIKRQSLLAALFTKGARFGVLQVVFLFSLAFPSSKPRPVLWDAIALLRMYTIDLFTKCFPYSFTNTFFGPIEARLAALRHLLRVGSCYSGRTKPVIPPSYRYVCFVMVLHDLVLRPRKTVCKRKKNKMGGLVYFGTLPVYISKMWRP